MSKIFCGPRHNRRFHKEIYLYVEIQSFDGRSFGIEFSEYRQKLWEENKNILIEEYKKSEWQYNESKDVFVY